MTNQPVTSATELARSAKKKKPSQKEIMKELVAMSDAMVDQDGLLNHSQAALVLEITPARVTELVNLGKLDRYDFLGRTYVSVRQVVERRKADIKAGRPPRGILEKISLAVKSSWKEDALLKFQKSADGPYEQIRKAAERAK